MRSEYLPLLPLLLTLSLTGRGLAEGGEASLHEAVETKIEDQAVARRAEATIESAREERQRSQLERLGLESRRDALASYHDQLEAMVQTQATEVESLREQLGRLDETRRQVLPLLGRMVETLNQFLQLDLPFLPEERTRRQGRLRSIMADPGISLGEKYRRVLEAFQIEEGYGRTLEAYRARLEDRDQLVDFLRLGRLALYCQSLDGSLSLRWDPPTHRWVALPPEFRLPLRKALQRARRQAPPDLVWLPVPVPVPVPAGSTP